MARVPAIFFLLIMLLAAFGVAQAQEAPTFETSGLLVYNVWVRPTAGVLAEGATPEAPIPGTVTGAFMTIQNTGDSNYQLVGVASDLAEMTHVHETTSSGEMSGMRMISAIDIPAGETVRLESGGYHVMLMDVLRDVYPGEAVALTLTFADSEGDEFDAQIGALATDFPTEDDLLIVANAKAVALEDGAVDLSLVLDNRGEADRLIGVSSTPPATSSLIQPEDGSVPLTVDIPEQARAAFSAGSVIIHLTDFEEIPDTAFTIVLTFESGKEITLAVPIIEEAA